jgi:hypothetical protein
MAYLKCLEYHFAILIDMLDDDLDENALDDKLLDDKLDDDLDCMLNFSFELQFSCLID